MDKRQNPYTPSAGSKPPELAGRDDILEKADIILDRIKTGKQDRGLVLYGLRGVGKTVLLNEIYRKAEAKSLYAVQIEALENRSLPYLLIPALRTMLLQMSLVENFRDKAAKAMRALGGFASAAKLKFKDLEFGFHLEKEEGLADSGDLEVDLIDMLKSLGEVAFEKQTAVILVIDELQYVPDAQLSALITALHRTSQQALPILLVAAGLPQILGQMGSAKSYAERLFAFEEIDRLDESAAKKVLSIPAQKEGVLFEEDALVAVLHQTKRYPYFLQEWGKHCWDIAINNRITKNDAKNATAIALNELDRGFFLMRFNRLTPSEKRYLRAMAELGEGPHRSGDVAMQLGKQNSINTAPTRASLIKKGMVYSPSHGDTAFTVPMFDGFMKRIMPDFQTQ